MWNENDSILKERLFGLAGPKGNHGEDVKEYYYYLDNTPTHCSMRYLYKYPHAEFPYEDLYKENARRDKSDREYELIDTGIFDDNRYFDVFVEYAKAGPEDICIKITAVNRGPETAPLHLLPTVWFRNTWSWANEPKPIAFDASKDGTRRYTSRKTRDAPLTRFTATAGRAFCFVRTRRTTARLFNVANTSAFTKDGIGNYIVHRDHTAIDPQRRGTKAAAHYYFDIGPGASREVYLRLTAAPLPAGKIAKDCEAVFARRRREADEFYAGVIPDGLSDDAKSVMRQSLAGLLWSKQYYHYIVKEWLEGDPAGPPPPKQRLTGRNSDWKHLYNADVISMPDKWEYPWYAVLGPRISLHTACARGSRICQGAAGAAASRMVHASERPDTGLRMGFRRRQSAGSRVGGLRVYRIERKGDRRRRPSPFWKGSFTSCC